MTRETDPQHEDIRALLRLVGPIVAGLGLLLTAIGMVSFFSAFGGFGPPRYFWCAFLGLPILAIGIGLTKFAYLGAITRYMTDEVLPVGKDAVNYMVDGTQQSIRQVAAAVADGLRGETEQTACPSCSTANDPAAKFCKQCGISLAAKRQCPQCAAPNDPDARFCQNCGRTLG